MKTEQTNEQVKLGYLQVQFSATKVINLGSIKLNTYAPCELFISVTTKKVTAQMQDGFEIDSIEYNDIVIDKHLNIRKFIEFHKEMGIDIQGAVDKIDDTISEQDLIKLIPKQIIKLIK